MSPPKSRGSVLEVVAKSGGPKTFDLKPAANSVKPNLFQRTFGSTRTQHNRISKLDSPPPTFWWTLQNAELVTQGEDLELKRRTAPEGSENSCQERGQ